MTSPAPATEEPLPNPLPNASLGRRLAALVYEGLLLTALLFAVNFALLPLVAPGHAGQGKDLVVPALPQRLAERRQESLVSPKELPNPTLEVMERAYVAWVLQNDNVAAALVGASRPEQVKENVKAAGVRIPDELMKRIDEALGDIVETDPRKTDEQVPKTRVA